MARRLAAALICCACLAASTGSAAPVDPNTLRGVGINYFDVFSRLLKNPDPAGMESGLDELARRKIHFIRFMCGAFWPSEWALYREDRAEWFRRMDLVFRAAEARGIGLVPSLCWFSACVPDLMDEPRNQWGNPDSKTIAFMRDYVTEVVARYKDSPALWAWEFGNEYSLEADLPNAAEHRPWVNVPLGTRPARGPEDDVTHDMVVTACREFAKAVRAVDPVHPVTTGHSLPRPTAEHFRRGETGQDSPEELVKNLLDATPDPMNLISVHVYPFDQQRRFGQEHTSYEEILRLCLEAARRAGKGLFIGEFGAPDTEKDGGPETARKEFLAQLAAIEKTGVPLAALWVYDFPWQESFINISPANHRAWMLDELEAANARMREAGPAVDTGASNK